MCTASVMFSPPSSSSLTLASTTTPRQERRRGLAADNEAQTPRGSSFTQYQSPRQRTPATSLILRSITPSNHHRPTFFSSFKPRAFVIGSPEFDKSSVRFDLLVYLPLEVSILILEYLEPKDLCHVCRVSRDWYRLSHHPPLLKQRRRYIKALREEYRLSKENYPTSTTTIPDNGTPQQTSMTSSRHMTVSQSPLNVIQPKSRSKTNNQGRSSSIVQSTLSPPATAGQTPCPAYLVEDVKKLSLNDGTAEVRRCLFPMADLSPTRGHKGTRTSWNQRSHHKCGSKGELMAGKKTNRSRLRRL